MSGIIHKIEEKLHMGGGHKEGDKEGHHGEHKKEEHKKEEHGHGGEQHKEGLVDKIKDKIHGDESGEKHHHKDGEGKKEKKKKKDKKEKKHDGHDSSSSSDSD
ncbi:dehydrin HIRD11 [Capsicum chacoense]